MKLQSKLAMLLCFVLLTVNVNAQFKIGGKVGVNLATQSLSDDLVQEGFDEKSVTGILFGAALELGVNDILSIQPELLFYQKGIKQEFEFLGVSGETTSLINYLEIPVLVKLSFGSTESTRFYVNAGPSIGYALSGTFDNGMDKMDIEFDDDDNRLDFGLAAGGGVAVPAGPGNFILDLRYLLGLSNLYGGEGDGEVMNRGIGISVGYMLALGE